MRSCPVASDWIPPSKALRLACRGVLMVLVAAVLVSGCSSSGQRGGQDCAPRQGMSAQALIRCGCFPAESGGGTVMIQGYGSDIAETISMVHYLCPRGAGKLNRVAVINGVVDRVLY